MFYTLPDAALLIYPGLGLALHDSVLSILVIKVAVSRLVGTLRFDLGTCVLAENLTAPSGSTLRIMMNHKNIINLNI